MVRAELKGAMNFIFLCRLRLLIRQGICEIDLFTDTATILNYLDLKSIVGCPEGMSTIRYTRSVLIIYAFSQKKIVMGKKIVVRCLDVIVIAFFPRNKQ